MQTKSLILTVYLIGFTTISIIFAHFFSKMIHEIHGLQKMVAVEMKEFSYASNEAWNEINLLKTHRRFRRFATSYRTQQYDPTLYVQKMVPADTYQSVLASEHHLPDAVAAVDGSSLGSINGVDVRKKEKLVKSRKKLEKKKNYLEICLADCQRKSKNCPEGPPGIPGKPGKDGIPGEPGVNGTNGFSGISVLVANGCIQCHIGKPGPRGKRGKRGKKGKDGKNGISVKAVIGLPGPTGEVGWQGYPGFPGPVGPVGPPGNNKNRYIGLPGPRGRAGRKGYQGAQGNAGFIYNTGIIGPSGRSGKNGLNGRTGATGHPGHTGRPGRDGNYCECPPMSRRNPFYNLLSA